MTEAWNVAQATKYLNEAGIPVVRETVNTWVNDGTLRSYKIGKRKYVAKSDIDLMLANTPWGEENENRRNDDGGVEGSSPDSGE